MTAEHGNPAREDWQERIYRRSDQAETTTGERLRAPEGLRLTPGAGLVTVDWEPTDGAIGYIVYRADHRDGPYVALDHGGSDVLAVPAFPYADAVAPGREYWYAVAATRDSDADPGPRCAPVAATVPEGPAAPVTARIDVTAATSRLSRVWRMIGSERLQQLWLDKDAAGNPVGEEFHAALEQAHDQLGVEFVRAHALFHDDVGVFSMTDAGPQFDFTGVDDLLDRLAALQIRPILELSFMPRDLARDPEATVFTYRGIISPPRDWELWGQLNARLAEHVVERYGIDEVAQWGFEVWNEPDLEVFWTGTRDEYFRLYDVAARAVKAVDSRLRVGGPATAAVDWVEEFVRHVADANSPLDFLTTHTYGNAPVDLRPTLQRYGLSDVEIWWTEWGVGHTHFAPIHDSVFGAPFVLRGFKAAQGCVDYLAYWVVSDHFEELGRPPRLFHGGFGLLTVGNLRKPRYWAVRLAEELGDLVLDCKLDGDGAGSLVDSWPTLHDDGTVDVLLWNACADAGRFRGDPTLDRVVRLEVSGLARSGYRTSVSRVDAEHSNIVAGFPAGLDWPDAQLWADLRRRDQLDVDELGTSSPHGGTVEVELTLPMPGVARLRLQPDGA